MSENGFSSIVSSWKTRIQKLQQLLTKKPTARDVCKWKTKLKVLTFLFIRYGENYQPESLQNQKPEKKHFPKSDKFDPKIYKKNRNYRAFSNFRNKAKYANIVSKKKKKKIAFNFSQVENAIHEEVEKPKKTSIRELLKSISEPIDSSEDEIENS